MRRVGMDGFVSVEDWGYTQLILLIDTILS